MISSIVNSDSMRFCLAERRQCVCFCRLSVHEREIERVQSIKNLSLRGVILQINNPDRIIVVKLAGVFTIGQIRAYVPT